VSEYKVGVVGLGFVGGALKKSFEGRGQKVVGYDKYKEVGTLEDVRATEILFLCLPTPFVEGHGYDLSCLEDVCRQLAPQRTLRGTPTKKGFSGIIVNKSTVEPGVTSMLADKFSLNMCHNPEFLTARTAFRDFDNQTHIVLGKANEELDLGSLHQLYRGLFPKADISICSSNESESMKLFCNDFYAVKVQMFNEFFLLCQRTGADFDKVKQMMLMNGWINEMHTVVPGPDGQLSYGGACFIKDTKALNHFMKTKGTPNKVLDACIKERDEMRKD